MGGTEYTDTDCFPSAAHVVQDAYDEDDFAFDHDTIEFPDGGCYNGDFLFQVSWFLLLMS
jgi:hypothetical protein